MYTSGYVAWNAGMQTDCNECKELFGNKGNTIDLDTIHFQYIHHLDMGAGAIDLHIESLIYGPAGSI